MVASVTKDILVENQVLKDRDIIVGYTDGFTDNVFPKMWPNCLIDNLDK